MLSEVRTFAYNNSEKNDIHGFMHVERVLKLSSEIGTALNANLPVIKIAALLHDVGRFLKKNDVVRNHTEISADIAYFKIFRREMLKYSKSKSDFQ